MFGTACGRPARCQVLWGTPQTACAGPIPRWLLPSAMEVELLDWNQHLLLLLNAPAHPAGWLVGSVVALANSPVIVAPLLLVTLWIWGVPSRRGALLAVAGALLVGQGINQVGSVKNLGRYVASWIAGCPNRPSSTATLT